MELISSWLPLPRSPLKEGMLDYIFLKLAVAGENVNHPILMSETLCNPVYSRGRRFATIPITSSQFKT